MMRIIAFPSLVGLLFGLTGCIDVTGWRAVRGSGNVVAEPREVAGFDRVSVLGSGELSLTQGNEEGLTIEADDNLLSAIESEVRNGHLTIGPRNIRVQPTRPIQYQLKFKDLRELHVSGSGRAHAETIKTDRLAVHISGSGKVNLDHLEVGTLASHISGSGDIAMAGTADRQEIRISGSGTLEAPDLRSSEADAHISGSGHASVWVDEFLDGNVSGSGRIEYRGDPKVESHVSGSGRVGRR